MLTLGVSLSSPSALQVSTQDYDPSINQAIYITEAQMTPSSMSFEYNSQIHRSNQIVQSISKATSTSQTPAIVVIAACAMVLPFPSFFSIANILQSLYYYRYLRFTTPANLNLFWRIFSRWNIDFLRNRVPYPPTTTESTLNKDSKARTNSTLDQTDDDLGVPVYLKKPASLLAMDEYSSFFFDNILTILLVLSISVVLMGLVMLIVSLKKPVKVFSYFEVS
jgi:hypothetical protein